MIKKLLLIAVVFTAVGVVYWWPGYGAEAKSFPGGFELSLRISILTGGKPLPLSFSTDTNPQGLPPLPMPNHPFQDNQGMAGAHGDSYNSGVVPNAGPVSEDVRVQSRLFSSIFSGCSTQHFDAKGRIIAVCVGFHKTSLVLLDPVDLSILAREELPAMAGWYFRLDPQGRVLVPAGDLTLRRYRIEEQGGIFDWQLDQQWDIAAAVPEDQRGMKSLPMDIVFDWQGNLWFLIWSPAVVGYVDIHTNEVIIRPLEGELIENGVGATPQGVFFVTDHNFYFVRASRQGVETVLHFPYDRGSSTKALSRGSGSTPVVFAGGKLVAFGDNADPRPNVLVYRLDDVPEAERLVCKLPMFEPGRSVLENSFIAYDHSIIIENNFNFSVFGDSSGGEPGIVRVDVADDFSTCKQVWENRLVASGSGAKLSSGNGLIYQYALEQDTGWVNAWYLTAIDFHTGKLVWKHYTGSGKQWDNAMLTLSISTDGVLTAGTFGGLIMARDIR